MRREICLAAGMLTDVPDPIDRITIAADAGFDGLGLRVDEHWPASIDLGRVQEALDSRRMTLLDIELVMITPDGRHDDQTRRAIAVARRLRPRHIVVVSFDDDHSRVLTALRHLIDALEGSDVRPVIEFLPFSTVRTLDEARSLATAAAGDDTVGVLVDVLHLVRSGGSPADVANARSESLPYLQVCDAGPAEEHPSRGALFREATGGRLLPGEGTLPVEATIAMFPTGAPLSVEVLSEYLMRHSAPQSRARMALDATCAMLQHDGRHDPVEGARHDQHR